jgi:alcohol dehydrogenase (cytochrome c)
VRLHRLISVGVICLAAATLSLAQQTLRPAGFNINQAIAGQAAYEEHCAACHGADLTGNGPAVALRGSAFLEKWSGKSADGLFAQIRRMPPGSPDILSSSAAANVFAYVLQSNGMYAGAQTLPATEEALSMLAVPAPGATITSERAREPVVIAPRGRSRLDAMTPVIETMLKTAPPADWLHWRRTYDAHGFSPLDEIERRNVAKLALAWSWSLPKGENMMAPIVHDGVMFTYSHGDVVEALDAGTGDLLWRFERKVQDGATFQGKKGVAIAGDAILVPTSDMRVLALHARTGTVLWEHAIDTGGQTGFQIKSAPVVAAGKVIIGVNGFTTRGGNFVVALDLKSGREAWRFNTVARPGEPGGNSWNGQSAAARTGGSVWVAGSYEPAANLLYFGVAPTYNPGPLRAPRAGFTTDALYTDSTVALNADTGKLVWYFQHQKNDQLDHDWAFEQQLIDLTIDGRQRRLVVTGGKQAIFEAMDAATGAYQFSIDLGMQNVISAIDPSTGAKTLNPAAMPAPGQVLKRTTIPGICPDLLGARNLMSTAYDAAKRTLFVPLTDTCIQPWPDGTRWQKHPDPSTAGKYGMLTALDLQTRKAVWTVREAAPPVSGALATAGDLIFLGDADRWFRAYDARSGQVLWQVRLDNAPASYPITYSTGGRQFVAVATNQGFVHVAAMRQAAGILSPPNDGATLWVFALPD